MSTTLVESNCIGNVDPSARYAPLRTYCQQTRPHVSALRRAVEMMKISRTGAVR